MLQNNTDSQKLFSKSVPVTIKEGLTNQCRNTKLFLSVEWLQTSTVIHRQELLITLTDNNDPFFLYNIYLSEEDFQILKSNQGLLVDFSAFPQKFIDLLEVCLAEESKVQPKFLLIFNAGDRVHNAASTSLLDIVETNQFKHLTHLSLKFLLATELSIKQYLASCFKNLKEENHQLKNRLCYLEQDSKDKLTCYEETLSKKVLELESVRKELSVELSVKESKHARELQEEREKLLTKQREEENRTDRDRKEKEADFRKEIMQLESRVSCLDTLNKELQNKNHKRDDTIRDLRSRLSALEEDLRRNREHLHAAREQNEQLVSEAKEQRLHVCHQKERIDEVEQELTRRKQQNSRLQEQFEAYQRQASALQEELVETKHLFQQNAKNNESLHQHIEKANDVIKKLQHENESNHEKLKQSRKICSDQKHELIEKQKIVEMLKRNLVDLEIELKRKSSDVGTLSDSVHSLKVKITYLEKEQTEKVRIIKFLNDRLTEKCMSIPQKSTNHFNANPIVSNQFVDTNSTGDTSGRTHSPITNNPVRTNPPNTRSSLSPLQKIADLNLEPTHSRSTDSAYVSSPSLNARTSTGDVNKNTPSIEVDSAALSAAFGNDRITKHSTAKKPASIRGAKGSKKN